MNKQFYILIFFLFMGLLSVSQSKSFDVKRFASQLDTIKDNNEKCRFIIKEGEQIVWSQPDFIPYADKALELAYQSGSDKMLADAFRLKGRIAFYNGNITDDIIYFGKAAVIYESLHDGVYLVDCYNRIANDYFYIGEYDNAFLANKKLMEFSSKYHNYTKFVTAVRQIGVNYLKLLQFDSAYVYLNKALKLSVEPGQKRNLAYSYSEVGEFYFNKKLYHESIKYNKKAEAVDLSGVSRTKHVKTLIFQRLAKSYLELDKTDSAALFIEKALMYDRKLERLNVSCEIAARVYLKKKEYGIARKYLDTAVMLSLKTKSYQRLNRVYGIISNIYLEKNDLKKVHYYDCLRLANEDSIYKNNLYKQLESIRIHLTLDDFNNKYKLLLKQKELREAKLLRYKTFLVAGLILLTFFIIFVSVLYLSLRKIKKKNEIILNQKRKLEKQKEELEESLNEIKNMQKQLVQSKKMASIGVLSAGIAHEINNPINFVYSGINSLSRDIDDVKKILDAISKIDPESDDVIDELKKIELLKQEYEFEEALKAIPNIIADIKLGAKRTAEIVRGLRNFTGSDKDDKRPYNLHEALDMALLLLKNKYKNRIEIVKQYDGSNLKVECFPGKINQAFLNILSNAMDAIEGDGKIWITTKSEKDKVIISIKDTGRGINHDDLDKIFDPFYTTKDVGKGTGLGLYITYEIIKKHEGEISVSSILSKGTEFIIVLPR